MAAKITIQARKHPGDPLSPTEVMAERYGKFWAVNPNPFETMLGFNVTHVPSGLAVAQVLSKITAVRLAQIFAAKLDVEVWEHERDTPIAEAEMRRMGWA